MCHRFFIKWTSEETLLHVDKWTFLCVLTICSAGNPPTSLPAFFTGNKRETNSDITRHLVSRTVRPSDDWVTEHSGGFTANLPHSSLYCSSLLIFPASLSPPPACSMLECVWFFCVCVVCCQSACMCVGLKPECEGSERSLPQAVWESGCQTCWHCSPGPHYSPQ